MKFQIVCNQPGRLRLRFGKYVFTKEQCYGLTDLLLSVHGVQTVESDHVNGSLLIGYTGETVATEIIGKMTALKRADLKDGIPTQEQKNRELDVEFQNKLIWMCTKRLAEFLILPAGYRHMFAWGKAIPYFRMGLQAIRRMKMSVELLDATAIGASLCCGNHSAAGSTMFLLKLSDLLLEYSNARAKNALANSLAVNVSHVWKIVDGAEVYTPMEAIEKEDIIRIRKGSMVPVDGTIVAGDGLLNEATMTGEPLPVHKGVTGTVFAGTLLEEGELDVAVLAKGSQSRIAKIIDLIDTGESTKAAIQSKAERLADGIVPISFGLFLATLGLTGNTARALSVLMVDFSCAIKLTTPITIISALKEGAQNGIVIKGGKYLELLSQVDTVVFDKTGTLTNAVPKVSKVIVTQEGYTEEKVLRIAACLEEHFPHSVAAAIVAEAGQQNLIHPEDHEKVEYIVAHGIASRYRGKRSIIGSYHFVFEDEAIPFPHEKQQWLEAEIGSDSAIYLAVDGLLVGILCVNDPARDEAPETIAKLRQAGISNIVMITGDGQATARHISGQLGLDSYYASVLPDGKAKIVEQLKADGHTVLMVGDGINDTPALSTADVSLTLYGASDVAREVADVTVLSHDLRDIVVARQLATALVEKIKRHYRFIVGFNSGLILLGLFGAIPATTSAWLHNASTVSLAALSARPMLNKPKEVPHETT